MKKQILTLITALLTIISFSQNTYYPDGKKYTGEANTINQLNKVFEENGLCYTHMPAGESHPDFEDDYTLVAFKLFTNKPLYVITENPNKIQKAINSFDIDKFFDSYHFEMALESYIDKGNLFDLFILETLGTPSKQSTYYEKDVRIDRWSYSELGVTLTFKNGIATSYYK